REQILCFGALRGGAIERGVGNDFVADGNVEAGAKLAQFFFVQLFLLVGDVAAFTGFTEAVAFNGFGEDDGGLAFVFGGGFVSGIDFSRVMPAAVHAMKLLVGEMVDHPQQLRVGAKEVFADVTAGSDGVLLVFAIDGFFHAFEEQAIGIGFEERIPVGAPD